MVPSFCLPVYSDSEILIFILTHLYRGFGPFVPRTSDGFQQKPGLLQAQLNLDFAIAQEHSSLICNSISRQSFAMHSNLCLSLISICLVTFSICMETDPLTGQRGLLTQRSTATYVILPHMQVFCLYSI